MPSASLRLIPVTNSSVATGSIGYINELSPTLDGYGGKYILIPTESVTTGEPVPFGAYIVTCPRILVLAATSDPSAGVSLKNQSGAAGIGNCVVYMQNGLIGYVGHLNQSFLLPSDGQF